MLIWQHGIVDTSITVTDFRMQRIVHRIENGLIGDVVVAIVILIAL